NAARAMRVVRSNGKEPPVRPRPGVEGSAVNANALGKPSGAGEEVERGRRQLLVVAGGHEAPALAGGVEGGPGGGGGARAGEGEVVLGLEGVEHQDPAVAWEPAVIEEAKRDVAHRQAVPPPRELSAWLPRTVEPI